MDPDAGGFVQWRNSAAPMHIFLSRDWRRVSDLTAGAVHTRGATAARAPVSRVAVEDPTPASQDLADHRLLPVSRDDPQLASNPQFANHIRWRR
jgi:hypothetical protein